MVVDKPQSTRVEGASIVMKSSPVLELNSSMGDEPRFEQVHWLFRCPRARCTVGSLCQLVAIDRTCESAAL